MIYQFFPLIRDPTLQRTTFGRSEMVGYDRRLGDRDRLFEGWDGLLTAGLPITFTDTVPRSLPLYKSVEAWSDVWRTGQTKQERFVIVERLYYQDKTGYIPYALRQFEGAAPCYTLLHLANIERIHEQIQGLDGALMINDPRRIYIEAIENSRSWYRENALSDLKRKLHLDGEWSVYTRHVDTASDMSQILTGIYEISSGSRIIPHTQPLDSIRFHYQYCDARPYVLDPITRLGNETISPHMLDRHVGTAHFDVSVPAPIEIPQPEILHAQDATAQHIAAELDRIPLTDFSVEISTHPDAHNAQSFFDFWQDAHYVWHYAVDRYIPIRGGIALDQLPKHPLMRIAHRVLDDAQLTNKASYEILRHHLYTRNVRLSVQIQKSFADEALITLLCDGRAFCAWHVDIAVTVLCSMGLSVEYISG